MTVALVTAVYGSYDTPKPLPADHGFDQTVLVSDSPAPVPGWTVVVEPSQDHPRLAAKRPKMLPMDYTDCDASVWIDGSFTVLPGGGLREAADRHLADGDLVAFTHPSGRVDAYEEAAFSSSYAKYADVADQLLAQAAAYREAGLPVASGLWECGVLARRHTDEMWRFGQSWLHQCRFFTVQDQVSFPHVAWSRGVAVAPWRAASHWDCGWVEFHPHRDDR